ncbi:unnamed protein product [Meloidogyne enterolobii]|uniref:Uncharacterized protein n=2 Tax=Meloidogyne enterolobii TaxID=390850 RepID=A0ACB1AAC4_MELEN
MEIHAYIESDSDGSESDDSSQQNSAASPQQQAAATLHSSALPNSEFFLNISELQVTMKGLFSIIFC